MAHLKKTQTFKADGEQTAILILRVVSPDQPLKRSKDLFSCY